MKRSIFFFVFIAVITGALSAQTGAIVYPTNYNLAVGMKGGAFSFGEAASVSYTISGTEKLISATVTNLDFYETSLEIGEIKIASNTFIVTIRSFEVSNFLLPAFIVTSVTGADTNIFYTPRIPVENDKLTTKEKELQPLMEIYDFADWSWLIWAGAGLALAAAAFFVIRSLLAGREKRPKKLKPEDPYEHTRLRLKKIAASGLAQENPKDYFAGVSEIVREFLENTLDINALEMATTEIRDRMKASSLDTEVQEIVLFILKICDRVKYAKHKASEENISQVYKEGLNLVDRVKLVQTQETPPEETK
ncbi:MAG: hypothetical protein A2Y33_14575 [Spirochaetes bacterium GWF1_51_8]|nr:MAG: hypothetical protein A2Y33_14575 [Spirochaetes bacterium GWF1_51_8]